MFAQRRALCERAQVAFVERVARASADPLRGRPDFADGIDNRRSPGAAGQQIGIARPVLYGHAMILKDGVEDAGAGLALTQPRLRLRPSGKDRRRAGAVAPFAPAAEHAA